MKQLTNNEMVNTMPMEIVEATELPAEITAGNECWEKNHRLITKEIHHYLKRNECMPTKTELADITGLSRFTIYKHMKAYGTDVLVKQEEESFRMMRATMLAGLFKHAMNGDPRAARLYFEIIDKRLVEKVV